MATTKNQSVRAKLAQARLQFLNENIKKSGANNHLEFMYFELSDIVPLATKIFAEVGLVSSTNFSEGTASMTIFSVDDESEGITFSVPFISIPAITSPKVTELGQAAQSLGSEITYLRRYLYMMALDIVEHDDIEPRLKEDGEVEEQKPVKEEKHTAPATPAERQEIKKELVSEDVKADENQIKELKTICKELLDKDSTQEEFIQQIAMKTKGFTDIKASACVALIENLKEMLAAYGGNQ